jgi:signal transduction histidine kinase
MRKIKTTAIGGLIFWLACASPALLAIQKGTLAGTSAAIWIVAFLLYCVVLSYDSFVRSDTTRHRSTAIVAFWMLLVLGFVLIWFSSATVKYVSSAALVLAAQRLPRITSERNSWLAACAIELVLIAILALHESWQAILGNGGAMAASLLFIVTFGVQERREQAARTALGLANVELLATREQLAQSSRAAERVRISRDLHDTLGHHLTALSIQLDVASRRGEGATAEHIREAHAIVRLLLGDVRAVVGELRTAGDVNLTDLLRPLCRDIGDLRIHLEMPDAMTVSDAARAETVLRCVQEVITNALKHAQARHVRIHIDPGTAGIDIHAQDDGRGCGGLSFGHGLTGMRERFERFGGNVTVESEPNKGLMLHATLPYAVTLA